MKDSEESADGKNSSCDAIEHHQLTVTSLSGKPLLELDEADDGVHITKYKQKLAKESKKLAKASKQARVDELRRRFVAPDGGYGWVVAFGAFLVQFWIADDVTKPGHGKLGLIKSYGVIFMEVMQLYPDASASLASWIPAILSCLSLMLAPTASGLCEKFSCRTVVFIGGLLCCLGLSLSFFATNLSQLCLTFGVLTGLGGGLSTTPGIIMTSRYFSKHRALANGICVSGTAAGSMVIPPLMQLLVPIYGFKGCILILGACMGHVCLSAVLYRPIEIHQAIVEYEREQKAAFVPPVVSISDANNEGDINKDPVFNQERCLSSIPEDDDSFNDNPNELRPPTPARPRGWSMVHSMEDISTDSTIYLKEEIKPASSKTDISKRNEEYLGKKKTKSFTDSVRRYIDISLLANPLFLLLTVTVMLMGVGCPHALYFLPSHANSLGLSRNDCSLLLSISAAIDFIGRIGVGYVADLKLIPNSKAYSLSILTTGIAVLCIPFASTFSEFSVIVGFYGLGLGSWFLLIPVLLNEHHGTEAIASSYGFVRLFQGMVTLVVPPVIGFSKDATGSYVTGFYVMGTSMIIGAILINLEPYVKNKLALQSKENTLKEKGSA